MMSQLLASISEVNTTASAEVEAKSSPSQAKSRSPAISYSKDFLLALQFAPSSLVKPDLPELNFVCEKPLASRRRESCPAVVPTSNWRVRSPSCSDSLSSSPVTSSYFNAFYQNGNSSSFGAAAESARIKRSLRRRPFSESSAINEHTSGFGSPAECPSPLC